MALATEVIQDTATSVANGYYYRHVDESEWIGHQLRIHPNGKDHTGMIDFTEVSDEWRERLAQQTVRGGRYQREVAALLAGKTIFRPGSDEGSKVASTIRTNIYTHSDNTKRLRVRKAEVDGQRGSVMWLVEARPR